MIARKAGRIAFEGYAERRISRARLARRKNLKAVQRRKAEKAKTLKAVALNPKPRNERHLQERIQSLHELNEIDSQLAYNTAIQCLEEFVPVVRLPGQEYFGNVFENRRFISKVCLFLRENLNVHAITDVGHLMARIPESQLTNSAREDLHEVIKSILAMSRRQSTTASRITKSH